MQCVACVMCLMCVMCVVCVVWCVTRAVCDFGLLGVVVEEEIASAEYFSFQKEKRITRNYATMISVFRFDAAQGSRFCNAG